MLIAYISEIRSNSAWDSRDERSEDVTRKDSESKYLHLTGHVACVASHPPCCCTAKAAINNTSTMRVAVC